MKYTKWWWWGEGTERKAVYGKMVNCSIELEIMCTRLFTVLFLNSEFKIFW